MPSPRDSQSVLPLVSLPLWKSVSAGRVELEIRRHPNLKRHWDRLQEPSGAAVAEAAEGRKPKGGAVKKRRRDGDDAADGDRKAAEAAFVPSLLRSFLGVVESLPADDAVPADVLTYCERFVELLADLLSQLPTRRFLRLLVLDQHVLVRCRMSALASRPEAKLFRQLLDVLAHYHDFEIDDQSGVALTLQDMERAHYARVQVCVTALRALLW
jgi:intron-binding protein aquarius